MINITNHDLELAIFQSAELSRLNARKALNAILSNLYTALVLRKKVQIEGFGTLQLVPITARVRAHPRTKAPIVIPAHVNVKLIYAPALFRFINLPVL